MTVAARVGRAVGSARIHAHMFVERLTDPHPRHIGTAPISAEYITHPWLEEALCRKVPGARIERFELGERDIGTTARRMIEVTYNDAGTRAGLPTQLFAKATPEFMSRMVCGLSGSLAHETNFYNVIQPMLDIETPACYHAGYDRGSFRSIYLFENARVTKGAKFLDPSHKPNRVEAEGMVRTMAKLHSRFWGDPILDRQFTWLKDPLTYQRFIDDLIGFRDRTQAGQDRAVEIMPARLAARRDQLWDGLYRSHALRAQAPRTLLHADIHIGNWYRVGEDRMGLCDWQCTVKGNWAGDFAYAVTCSLDIAERRAWERDLLRLYLDLLDLPAGQARPSFDEAWLAYRQQVLHGLYSWFFVAGTAAGDTALHANAIWQANLARMSTAADDLETLDSLGL